MTNEKNENHTTLWWFATVKMVVISADASNWSLFFRCLDSMNIGRNLKIIICFKPFLRDQRFKVRILLIMITRMFLPLSVFSKYKLINFDTFTVDRAAIWIEYNILCCYTIWIEYNQLCCYTIWIEHNQLWSYVIIHMFC